MMPTTETKITTATAPPPPVVPTLDVFFCPCCGTPSQDFAVSLHPLGFSFSMTCPMCKFPVEALINTPVLIIQQTLGLA